MHTQTCTHPHKHACTHTHPHTHACTHTHTHTPFLNNCVVIQHSSTMQLADRGLAQMHFTFCEHLVFYEFKQTLYIRCVCVCVCERERERERETNRQRQTDRHLSVCLCLCRSINWILMSCQPHRVTPGQSNSGHKQIHISKLFSHMYQPSVKSIYKTNHFTNMKHTYTNIIRTFSKS